MRQASLYFHGVLSARAAAAALIPPPSPSLAPAAAPPPARAHSGGPVISPAGGALSLLREFAQRPNALCAALLLRTRSLHLVHAEGGAYARAAAELSAELSAGQSEQSAALPLRSGGHGGHGGDGWITLFASPHDAPLREMSVDVAELLGSPSTYADARCHPATCRPATCHPATCHPATCQNARGVPPRDPARRSMHAVAVSHRRMRYSCARPRGKARAPRPRALRECEHH